MVGAATSSARQHRMPREPATDPATLAAATPAHRRIRCRRSIRREAGCGRSCRRGAGYYGIHIRPSARRARLQVKELLPFGTALLRCSGDDRGESGGAGMDDFERASSDGRRWPDRLTKPGAVDDSVTNRRAGLHTASTSEIRSTRGILSTAARSRERARRRPRAPTSPLPRDRVAHRPIRSDAIRCAVGGVNLILRSSGRTRTVQTGGAPRTQ